MTLAALRNPVLNSALGTPGGSPGATFGRVENLISTIIGLITVVGSIYFVFQIFTGAVQWITAGSDKDGVQKSKTKFTNALVGLIILLFAYALIAFVANILGYNVFGIKSALLDSIL